MTGVVRNKSEPRIAARCYLTSSQLVLLSITFNYRLKPLTTHRATQKPRSTWPCATVVASA